MNCQYCNGIVLRGCNRIIIPTSLRSKAIDLAHIGHQGIMKTKLLREKVWFPGIDKMAEEKINTTASHVKSQPKESCHHQNLCR